MLSPYLFNFYAECIMGNTGLNETQARIKIARRNINNLRYADDTIFMTESEELKSLLMSEKVGLKLNIQKTKIIWSHHFMANTWGNGGRLFFGAPRSPQGPSGSPAFII